MVTENLSVEAYYKPEIKMMPSTQRHSEILSYIDSKFVMRNVRRELRAIREQVALVYNHGKLIDLASLDRFQVQKVEDSINFFKIVYPDYYVFKDNPYLTNLKKTRFVGIPDLIIEVWSEDNTEKEKEAKRHLFQTGKSEFWELEQDSMMIRCWRKDGSSYQQFLDQPIKLPWGEESDWSLLALDVKSYEPNDEFQTGIETGQDIDV